MVESAPGGVKLRCPTARLRFLPTGHYHCGMKLILVTGFEPYGGRQLNPAQEIMRRVDGRTIGGRLVAGRPLPVAFEPLKRRITELLDELQPSAIIGLGLWPGEAVIRLERVGLNLADFETTDNEGKLFREEAISSNGASARFATLPLRRIEQALLAAGIPARVTTTAGTFLCNACLYSLLEAAEHRSPSPPCGFIHVPYLPEQVAERLAEVRARGQTGIDQRSDLPSMDLSKGLRAVEIAIEQTAGEAADTRRDSL
jgi:pyroglutamyl-peptidase